MLGAFHSQSNFIKKLSAKAGDIYASSPNLRRVRRAGRRLFHAVHEAQGEYRMGGPTLFLAGSLAVAAALTITTLYTPSYTVFVDGQEMGIIVDQDEITTLVTRVEDQGTALLGYNYTVDTDISYEFVLALNETVTGVPDLEPYLYEQMDAAGASLLKYQLSVDGVVLGVVEDEEALEKMLLSIRSAYHTEYTVDSSFVEDVVITPVYQASGLCTLNYLYEILTANTTGETLYTVVSGDTFNAIAYRNDMSASDLQTLNPDVDINKLSIGDTLNVKEIIPFLSVATEEEVVYETSIECPIVEVDDATIYTGNSKVLIQGEEGTALVEAEVSYVNGYEVERTIITSTTLVEPTTTTMAIGTMPRPVTASNGYYTWPISGTITSYFGTRYIFGSYSFHSGIDIAASYGASIKAADGGTVTFAGYQGSYGYLVVITHDNGNQTYYAHNSSLLVSTGTKVYQGQVIAKAGSTGTSTGNHCHFEIRVNGTAVNPLSYLK